MVVLLAPRYKDGFLDRILKKIFGAQTVTVKLDALGSFVWKKCDGETPFQEILASIEESFSNEEEKLLERTELFLKELHRQGWIDLFSPQEEE